MKMFFAGLFLFISVSALAHTFDRIRQSVEQLDGDIDTTAVEDGGSSSDDGTESSEGVETVTE